MSVKIDKIKGNFQIDEKRVHVPFVVKFECPKCGAKGKHSLDEMDHLGFPDINAPFDYDLYCNECDHEWSVEVILEVNLKLA